MQLFLVLLCKIAQLVWASPSFVVAYGFCDADHLYWLKKDSAFANVGIICLPGSCSAQSNFETDPTQGKGLYFLLIIYTWLYFFLMLLLVASKITYYLKDEVCPPPPLHKNITE